jgi:hypothetical protein
LKPLFAHAGGDRRFDFFDRRNQLTGGQAELFGADALWGLGAGAADNDGGRHNYRQRL